MLLRRDGDAVIAIGQPAHAWLSGQLARAWGAERFGPVEPWEEVCLGAEQHDAGMAGWEAEPTLNPRTGLPHAFTKLPLRTHLDLWSGAAARILPQSRYAALLASLHGTALYERRDLARLEPGEAAAVRTFLAGQREIQRALRATLGVADEEIARNQRLVWTWDALSLALLLGWAPYTLEAVPAAAGTLDVALTVADDGSHELDPWPFREPELTVRSEGRRLTGRFADEGAMRAALAAAPWVTLDVRLRSPG